MPEIGGPSALRLGQAGNNVLPEPASLVPMSDLRLNEDSKISPRLAAPKSLAPLTSKSKASLQPLILPSMGAAAASNQDSKRSQIPNADGSETEFESAKTLMPNQGQQLDEIGALLGYEKDQLDTMKTSQNARSPGASKLSKDTMAVLNTGANDASSVMHHAEGSTYAAHQPSNRDEESFLGHINGLSPDE